MTLPTLPTNHEDCPTFVKNWFTAHNVDVTVSTLPPIVDTPYDTEPFVCPHGTVYWNEPTSEQIATWAQQDMTPAAELASWDHEEAAYKRRSDW